MKTKKTTQANLENKRGLFFQIGFVLVLAFILAAFEWSTRVGELIVFEPKAGDEVIEITPPIFRQEQDKPKQTPPAPVFEPIPVPDDDPLIDDDMWVLPTDEYDNSVLPVFEEKPEEVDEPFWVVDIKPKFMGKDDKAFREYIIKNINFPDDAIKSGLTGKVQVQFVVGTNGRLSDVKIIRGVHPIIDKEVLRVISESPEWEPGFYNGRYVKTIYGILIQFKLE